MNLHKLRQERHRLDEIKTSSESCSADEDVAPTGLEYLFMNGSYKDFAPPELPLGTSSAFLCRKLCRKLCRVGVSPAIRAFELNHRQA